MSEGKKGAGARCEKVDRRLDRLHQSDLSGAAGAGGKMMYDKRALVRVEQALAVVDQQVGCGAKEPVELAPQAALELAHLPHTSSTVRALLKVGASLIIDLAVGGSHHHGAAQPRRRHTSLAPALVNSHTVRS
jgi:hypothetical protein